MHVQSKKEDDKTMKSYSLREFLNEKGIEEAKRVMGYTSKQAIYNQLRGRNKIIIKEENGKYTPTITKQLDIIDVRDK